MARFTSLILIFIIIITRSYWPILNRLDCSTSLLINHVSFLVHLFTPPFHSTPRHTIITWRCSYIRCMHLTISPSPMPLHHGGMPPTHSLHPLCVQYQGTPLHVACYNGHTDTAALLLDRGADINALDQVR